jgi:hypothetical protein
VSAARGLAGLSVDVDSVAVHLRGYGVEDAREDGAHYRLAVPRMLELFASAGARATFFLIADEAERHPDLVRSIVAGGHEVGCHSATHRLPFDITQPDAARRELHEARARLAELARADVTGFRAPSWGVTERLIAELCAAGYRYDASSFPSWMLIALRWSISRRSQDGHGVARSSLFEGLFERATPYVVARRTGAALAEIPLCTVPFARLPYYHTLRFLLPQPVFGAIGALARLRSTPSYAFHAVDFLELARDGLDPRMDRHPGLDRPLEAKLDLARRSIADLTRRREVVPLGAIAERILRS